MVAKIYLFYEKNMHDPSLMQPEAKNGVFHLNPGFKMFNLGSNGTSGWHLYQNFLLFEKMHITNLFMNYVRSYDFHTASVISLEN